MSIVKKILSLVGSVFRAPKADLILFSIAAFFILFFIWASRSELEEVTRGNGKVIASSKVQVIQNLEGGIIRDIFVKTGQRVEKDQLLLKIDDTQFLGDLNSAKQQRLSLNQSLELLKEEEIFSNLLLNLGWNRGLI